MDVADGAGGRELAAEYRAEFPDDPEQLDEGFDIIADCLESPGPASTGAAERYDAVRAGSILRRFVRRLCLHR